jgi:hypothetical protein
MIHSRRVLLVEGSDDLHVISSLMQHHNVPELFQIVAQEGINALLEALPVRLKASGAKCVGIVIDANTSIDARWASIRSILLNAGYVNVPGTPDALGTIIEDDEKPRVGIWIMPDNRIPGMLEDFASFLIPSSDTLGRRARVALESIPPEERLFPKAHLSKAFIHTWLAWQEHPGTPMGLAITKKYFDATADGAKLFLQWIERLFIET